MKLTGRIDIAAPAREVWDFVLDPASLSSCVPGIGDVRQVDERTFEGTIRASVGPMHGDFSFRSVIERSDFPSDLLVAISGTDSVTHSSLAMAVRAALDDGAATATRMDYVVDVDVKGRLAILGEMVLRATAGAMIGQVSGCMRQRLEAAAATRPSGGER